MYDVKQDANNQTAERSTRGSFKAVVVLHKHDARVSRVRTGSPDEDANVVKIPRARIWAMTRPIIHAGMAYKET